MVENDQDGRGLASSQHQNSLPPDLLRTSKWMNTSSLFKIAKEIESIGLWRSYLSEQEHVVFTEAINGGIQKWTEFINHDGCSSSNGDSTLMTTAFRSREMIFEQVIPLLWNHDYPCCRTRINLKETFNSSTTQPDSHPVLSFIPQQTDTMNEDDDYDDTNTEQKSVEVDQPAKQHEPDKQSDNLISSLPTCVNKDIKIPLYDMYHTIEYDVDAMQVLLRLEESDRKNEDETENDATEREQQPPSSSSQQPPSGGDAVIRRSTSTQPSAPKPARLNLAQFGDANLSMKYLLHAIDERRELTALSDRELKTLLSDVRPNRSKWASDDKVGQEELYDAAERVIISLRNHTEHSFPFLSKVNKRDAPDYFDVIKKPMDLGTVMRKLKGLAYRSKQQFAEDLDLIWSNCLLYNSDPSHPFRKHAIAMKKKSNSLLTYVPDVVVRDRAEVEAEEEAGEAGLDDESEDEKSTVTVTSSRKATKETPIAMSMKTSSNTISMSTSIPQISQPSNVFSIPNGHGHAHSEDLGENNGIINGYTQERSLGELGKDDSKVMKSNGISGNGLILSVPDELVDSSLTNIIEVDIVDLNLEKEEQGISSQIYDDEGDLQFQIWKDFTEKTRARAAIQALKYSSSDYVFEEQLAIRRTAADMKRFLLVETNHSTLDVMRFDDVDKVTNKDKVPTTNKNNEEAEEEEADIFLPQYAFAAAIPDIKDYDENEVNPELEEDFEKKIHVPKLHRYKEAEFPKIGLHPMIGSNVEKLKQVRELGNKCQMAKNPMNMSFPAELDEEKKSNEMEMAQMEEDTIEVDENSPPFHLNDDTAALIGEKVVAKLLAHVGFEGSQVNAFDTFNDLFRDVLMNFGKTLRLYVDRQQSCSMTSEEMILHTLLENGIEDVGDLETYIKDDIERVGMKLSDLYRKLEVAFQEIMYGVNDGEAIDEDTLFEHEGEFVTGGFSEGMGEDFFGFKELGLDKELGLSNLSVPMKLFHGRPGRTMPFMPSVVGGIKEKPPQYPPPPIFDSISEKDINDQIGLLRDFFKQKLMNSPNGQLIEDEFLPLKQKPFRPKVPPSGKINTPKRKAPLNGLNESGKKKKNNASGSNSSGVPISSPLVRKLITGSDKEKDMKEEEGIIVQNGIMNESLSESSTVIAQDPSSTPNVTPIKSTKSNLNSIKGDNNSGIGDKSSNITFSSPTPVPPRPKKVSKPKAPKRKPVDKEK